MSVPLSVVAFLRVTFICRFAPRDETDDRTNGRACQLGNAEYGSFEGRLEGQRHRSVILLTVH